MLVSSTAMDGVLEAVPDLRGDTRGWFSEVWSERAWREHGVEVSWVQENESSSANAGTLRGIHFQVGTNSQAKLVRVVSGTVLDVIVDLRRSSTTFGEHMSVELSSANRKQLFIPQGFGHGFVTLEDNCHVAYKVSAPYDPLADRAVQALDPLLAIDWRIPIAEMTRSPRDVSAPLLADVNPLFDE